MIQYLQETAKNIGIDMIDSGLCLFIWKVCDGTVFEHIRSSDFIAFINLHENATAPKILKRKIVKMCYVLNELSKYHSSKGLVGQWLEAMLNQLKIDSETYEHHHIINTGAIGTCKSNIKFAKSIQEAIDQFKTIDMW